MSKVIKKKSVTGSKKSKVSKKDIGQTLDETVEWMILKFDILKSSKKIKRLTKTFTQKLAAELKYLSKKTRKRNTSKQKSST